jgi:hypothetical protein
MLARPQRHRPSTGCAPSAIVAPGLSPFGSARLKLLALLGDQSHYVLFYRNLLPAIPAITASIAPNGDQGESRNPFKLIEAGG